MDVHLGFKSQSFLHFDRVANLEPIAQFNRLAFKTFLRQTDSRIYCEIMPRGSHLLRFLLGFLFSFSLILGFSGYLFSQFSILFLAIVGFLVIILGFLQFDRESLEIDRLHFCLERKWMGFTWFRAYGRTAQISRVDVAICQHKKCRRKTRFVIWQESRKYKFVKKHYFGARLSDRLRENLVAIVRDFVRKQQPILVSASPSLSISQTPNPSVQRN